MKKKSSTMLLSWKGCLARAWTAPTHPEVLELNKEVLIIIRKKSNKEENEKAQEYFILVGESPGFLEINHVVCIVLIHVVAVVTEKNKNLTTTAHKHWQRISPNFKPLWKLTADLQ